jgi:hypothetical protein
MILPSLLFVLHITSRAVRFAKQRDYCMVTAAKSSNLMYVIMYVEEDLSFLGHDGTFLCKWFPAF